MAEAARVLEFPDDYYYGSAVPVREPAFPEWEAPDIPDGRPYEGPSAHELMRQRQKAREAAAAQAAQSTHGVSMFAILGSIVVGVLMIFTVLAQVSYNEVANESVRLSSQLSTLEEQERRLEIAFESVVDMKEVERYARDVLGMSKPETEQVAVIQSVQRDTAEVVGGRVVDESLRGFGKFLSSLAEYFKR